MSLEFSTGLKTYLLVTGSLKAALDGTCIRQYSGPIPDTADSAIGGSNTLLKEITVGGAGTGITFESTPVGNALVKKVSETWTGVNLASGTATFYRQCSLTDAGGASTTERRIQGTIGVSGEDMNLPTTALIEAEYGPITYHSIALSNN